MPEPCRTFLAASAVSLPSQQAMLGLPQISPFLASPATAWAASSEEDRAVGQFIARIASTPSSAATADTADR
jgi:hypothetical protein